MSEANSLTAALSLSRDESGNLETGKGANCKLADEEDCAGAVAAAAAGDETECRMIDEAKGEGCLKTRRLGGNFVDKLSVALTLSPTLLCATELEAI